MFKNFLCLLLRHTPRLKEIPRIPPVTFFHLFSRSPAKTCKIDSYDSMCFCTMQSSHADPPPFSDHCSLVEWNGSMPFYVSRSPFCSEENLNEPCLLRFYRWFFAFCGSNPFKELMCRRIFIGLTPIWDEVSGLVWWTRRCIFSSLCFVGRQVV